MWIIINPDTGVLANVVTRIKNVLPRSIVRPVATTFRSWLSAKAPELRDIGSLVF